ncbi:MAG TPA: NYN domain-containing protein, partial [Polyangiaceae bacterium]
EGLEKERDFEMSLIRAGIVPHYSPVRETPKAGLPQDEQRFTFAQKGVDVEFAIDVLDFANSNRFDVAVLVAGDEDFVPLVRRVESLGKQILLAHFVIEGWTDKNGKPHRPTFTSRALQDAANWCLNFNTFVQDPERKAEVKSMFFMPKAQGIGPPRE